MLRIPIHSWLSRYARPISMLFAAALACSATTDVRGQSPTSAVLDPSLRITQYVHDTWQVQDGLPQNSVYAVLQTRNGYLWLGTQEGLARFDGLHFQSPEDAGFEALQSQEVRALLEDREGGLWVGTNGGGVSRLYDGSVKTYTTADGLSSDLVRSLYQDREGNIWIGTINGGLTRWDGSSFSNYTTDQGLCGNVVLAISEDALGTLWVGTEAGLSRMGGGSFSCETGANEGTGTLVWSLLPARDGSLWVGTDAGLIHRTASVQTVYTSRNGLCGDAVSALHEDAAGSLWIGTLGGGMCRFRDGHFESYGTAQGLTHNRVRTLFQDREGSLWIGTEGGGLNRLRQGKFAPLTTLEGLSSNAVYTVLEDRIGAVWAGTHGGGLNRIHDGTVTHYSRADALPSDNVYALHEDNKGRLWAGFLNGGLCRFDAPGWRCFTMRDGLSSDNVYALEDDPSGILWIGTDAGLDQLKNGRISPFTADTSLSGALISALHRDGTGALWIGTYGAGLARIKDDKVDRYTSAAGLTSDIVLALYEGESGIIWIGTQGGGLCRVSETRAACITADDGLLSNNILQIEEDLHGDLWLGSNKGILRLDRGELAAVMSGNAAAVHPVLYGQADGLRSSEANGGTQPASWRTRDGRLLFSTMGGIATIDPARIPANKLPPPVALQRFLVNGEAVQTTAGQVLGPGLKDLSFTYAGLSLAAPGQVHFQYRLDGYDEAWVDADTRREAFYTNLPPGTYRFKVRASNNDGVWSPVVELASFRLRPHFYQTAWFAVLCALAAMLAAFGAYRIRVNQLKARGRELERQVEERTHDLRLEKEKTEQAKAVIEEQASRLQELDRFKTRFFANISHEFRTPLTMIVGPLENALHGTYGPLSDRLRQQAELMLRNGLRLLRLINQLLDLSKLEAGKMELRACPRDIVSFVEGIVLSCSAFAERKGITLDFSSASESCEVFFEPDKLEKVFFNLLSNALKFTPAQGRVAVTVRILDPDPDGNMKEGEVEVSVSDSGKGIPADQLPYVFDRFHQVDGSNTREHEGTGIGLSLARELVLLHGGNIDATSAEGTGATFVVTLPRGRNHLEAEELVAEESEPELYHEALAELATAAFDYMNEGDAAPAEPISAEPPQLSHAPLVLIADDNKDVRDYVTELLSREFRVATASNGEEALAKAEELVPDIVISDVMMPKMDGNELCSRIKNTVTLNHIPVVLLTARATHEMKIEGLSVGADDYLSKPFNAEELLTRTRNLLRLRRQEQQLKEINAHLEQRVKQQVDLLMQERIRYEADLISAKERAEASDRLKTTILNNLNHELRTPLAVITGYSEMLGELVPTELQEFTSSIHTNGERLLQTLATLLDLAQISGRAMDASAEVIDVSSLVEDTLTYYRRAAASKGLSFETELPPDPVVATLNPGCLRRILSYLVDNAVKFTETGQVRVALTTDRDRLRITVEDTGIGISPEFMPHLFEEFVQESAGDARQFEGAGLGLSIAGHLTELLDGEILVQSEKGRGSTFTFVCPTHQPTTSLPIGAD